MIIAIVGPTGVGKTKLSIELAKKYDAEIINGDSTQIYRDINIGTAKVTKEETNGVKHHLIDHCDLNEEYTVYNFQKDGRAIINRLRSQNKNIIIVGGSGLYLSALLYDYQFQEETKDHDINLITYEEMVDALNTLGINIDKQNKQRLTRAYIKYIINNSPINENSKKMIYDATIIGLTTNREDLYQGINQRVDLMIKSGLASEVENLFYKYPNSKQLKTTIGYKEFIPYLNKEIELEEVINQIKQNSRRFAKRQYTWLNNKMDVKWFDVNFDDFNETIDNVIAHLTKYL